MREILFRGKRLDDEGWIEGCYYESKLCGCYILVPEIKVRKKDGVVIGDSFDVYQVVTETVGQFTGLYDKSGKRIWEGDIAARWKYGERIAYEITYCADVASFIGVTRTRFTTFDGDSQCFEVIGNKWDNPEMLGGSKWSH